MSKIQSTNSSLKWQIRPDSTDELFDSAQVRAALDAALFDLNDAARVRLLLDRTGATTVQLGPLPASSEAPVTLTIDWEPVSSAEVWQYHKTTRRGVYERRAARHPYADDVLMVNERTELTETTVANVALRLDGQWRTPPLESGCLPGIGRQWLLEQGQLRERPLTIDDLRAADGIAIVSSLRGWRQAVLAPGALDQSGHAWSSAGRGTGGRSATSVEGSSRRAGDADSGT